ncbi:TPA: hypothetical protein ACYHS5_003636, partial [Vibrio cholerae]|uniref:hypothetical protein n=1 Tax=Vibrio TaxID=662 RepID=UPI000893DE03|nr:MULTISPECIES: hypothetical protein [Vibrio]HAS6172522.1 hypothetical protein [Vibrio vulnificus]EGQ8494479.1 hypothetical protein [Vibrio cholerae]EGR0502975.1 hypothetical protein [Vibrio cholerae]EGR0525804.1 hypothetical protein [Vibrio cholerae]EGR0601604.1 hypothetical protein [Vibrio cholerae]
MSWRKAKLITVDRYSREFEISDISRSNVTSDMERLYPTEVQRLIELNASYASSVVQLIQDGHIVLRVFS